jgi:hypothetical protein
MAELSPWSTCAPPWNPSYRVAALRAGIIALVLLGILAAMILL